MLIEQEPRTFQIPEEGTYPAIFDSIEDLGVEPTVVERRGRKVAEQIHFVKAHFLVDVDGNKVDVAKKTKVSAHEKSNLYKWNKIFTGQESSKFDTDLWNGKPCMVDIVHNVDAHGSEWDNIGEDGVHPAEQLQQRIV